LVLSKKPTGKKFAFPRTLRITKRADFNQLRKVSQKWVSRHWILYYSRNELGVPRLALSISTKYGNAVERNRYRRWLRNTFRQHQADLPAMDMHFIARQKPANCEKKRYIEELNADFAKLVTRFR
jgi:ribonuclease P protein component